MRTPEELRRRLQSRWQNQRRNWLLGQGEWPLSLSTEPPTEAKVFAQWARFDQWLAQWREVAYRHADGVRYEARTWSRVGEQSLPCAWQFATPEAVATELGHASCWSLAKQRFEVLAAWRMDAAWHTELSRHFDLLADLDEAEFHKLCSVVEWLWRHPASGLYPRQLPVSGIDTKWLDSYRGVTAAWIAALRAAPIFQSKSSLLPEQKRSEWQNWTALIRNFRSKTERDSWPCPLLACPRYKFARHMQMAVCGSGRRPRAAAGRPLA